MKTTVLTFLALTFLLISASAQDLPNPPANLQVLPAGSYVIPMDNTLQSDAAIGSGKFNLAAYGLIVHLLNYNAKIKWVMKAGKVKDGIDFTATAQMVKPTAEASPTSRNFIAGPFVIFAADTTGIASLVNTFYTDLGLTGNNRPKLFKTTTATASVDIRYDLTGFKPKAAILSDGGNSNIHVDFMAAASIPVINYKISDGSSLQQQCYTFASEPHNDNTGATVDSAIVHIKQFVLSGRNFLAECKAVLNYENNPLGRFQTTTGIDNVNRNISTNVNFLSPDLSFYQIQGNYSASSAGSVKNWELLSTQSTTSISKLTGTGTYANVQAATMSKLTSSGRGGLVFYLGNHDFGTSNQTDINGIRMYMNAFLTPVAFNTYCETIPSQPLVVKMTNFAGNLNTGKITLNWMVAENEMVDQFEIQRSTDGLTFQNAALVFGSEKTGTENYQFAAPMITEVIYYRLKMTDISNNVTFSKVLVFKAGAGRDFQMKVLNNPVTDKLTLSFETTTPGPVMINIIDITGRQVLQKKLNSLKGSNLVSFPLPVLNNGMYVVDLFDGTSHNAAKFIK